MYPIKFSLGGFYMCWCEIVTKAKLGSLKRLGQGMEASLHFLAETILLLSCARVVVRWVFGI